MTNMTPWQWVGLGFGSALVSLIPILGPLALLVGYLYVAFSDSWKDHVLQNYAKGTLIIIAIYLVITLIFIGAVGGDAFLNALAI